MLSDGTVKCWGRGGEGQLGNGSTSNQSSPVSVSSVSNAVAITGGGDRSAHTCALISGGTVQCWGEGQHGILGNGATSSSSVPVSVSNINSATLIEGGGYHNCALISSGKIQCWGYGNSGQIGHGIFQNTNSEPAYVVGFGN